MMTHANLPLALQQDPTRMFSYRIGNATVAAGLSFALWSLFLQPQEKPMPRIGPVAAPVLQPLVSKAVVVVPMDTVVALSVVPVAPMTVKTVASAGKTPPAASATSTKAAQVGPAEPPHPAQPADSPQATAAIKPKPKPEPDQKEAYATEQATDGVSLPGLRLVGAKNLTMISSWLRSGLAVLDIRTAPYGDLVAIASPSGQFIIARPKDLDGDPRSNLHLEDELGADAYPLSMALAQNGYGEAVIQSVTVVLTNAAMTQLVQAAKATAADLSGGPTKQTAGELRMLACLTPGGATILEVQTVQALILMQTKGTCG